MVTYQPPTGSPEELADLGYDSTSWDKPWNLPRGQLTTAERMPTAVLEAGNEPHPLPYGPELPVHELTFDDPLTGRPLTGQQFLDRRVNADALLVWNSGRVVYETYRNAMTQDDRHIAHSCSKTMTTMMIGLAIDDGLMTADQPLSELVPELKPIPAWEHVSLQHVLDMSAGLDTEEHYENASSMYWRYADAVGYYPVPQDRQIGALAFVEHELVRRIEEPGARFNYASYLTNLLPIALANTYGVPAVDLYEKRIYQRIGAERAALMNLDSTGSPIVEGHLNLTLRDFARWGHPFLAEGRAANGEQVVPAAWIADTFDPNPARAAAFERSDYAQALPGAEYHNQAWVLDPRRGILAMLGIHGQFCYIDRSADLMIVGFSSYPDQSNALLIAVLTELWSTITRHITS